MPISDWLQQNRPERAPAVDIRHGVELEALEAAVAAGVVERWGALSPTLRARLVARYRIQGWIAEVHERAAPPATPRH